MVLLADDEVRFLANIEGILGRVLPELEPGLILKTASDGLEALRIVEHQAESLRLVMLDLHMPHIGGHAAAAYIRLRVPTVPIIPITAHRGATFLSPFRDMGCAEPLLKPFRVPDLVARIRQALQTPAGPPQQQPLLEALRLQARMSIELQGTSVTLPSETRGLFAKLRAHLINLRQNGLRRRNIDHSIAILDQILKK